MTHIWIRVQIYEFDGFIEAILQKRLCQNVQKFDNFLFYDFSQCITFLEKMASSSLKNTLFNIEKLDGTNFPFQKEQIYNVLVQKNYVKSTKFKGVKLEAMSQED